MGRTVTPQLSMKLSVLWVLQLLVLWVYGSLDGMEDAKGNKFSEMASDEVKTVLKKAWAHPKLILFLPEDTPKGAIEYKWHEKLQLEYGNRLLLLAMPYSEEAAPTFKMFKIDPKKLPEAIVVKPGKLADGAESKIDTFRWKDGKRPKWDFEMLRAMAKDQALPVLQKQLSKMKLDMDEIQVKTQQDFYSMCVAKYSGRCVILFVEPKKQYDHLQILADTMADFESVFYNFHFMWADAALRGTTVFNMKQMASFPTPQVVVLDPREKLMAPKTSENAKQLQQFVQAFDQHQAMSAIRDAQRTRKSPVVYHNLLNDQKARLEEL